MSEIENTTVNKAAAGKCLWAIHEAADHVELTIFDGVKLTAPLIAMLIKTLEDQIQRLSR